MLASRFYRASRSTHGFLRNQFLCSPAYRGFFQVYESNRMPQDSSSSSSSLYQIQTRGVRLNPLRFKMRKGMARSSIDAVVEPTPPKLIGVRSFFDLKRWGLSVYWNIRSWWESLDPRLSLKGMRKQAIDHYIAYHKAEASGDIPSINSISNLTFARELKKKIESQNRKGVTIVWNHDTPKAKVATIRYIRHPDTKLQILQVGVYITCKQGVTIKKKDKVLKEVPKKTITELLVMEASTAVTKSEEYKWKLLDVLDTEGYGILPSGQTQTYLEEQ